ncbi:phosphoglucomutase/phosphomannomutase family protein [Saliphagus infecundisoli]|uniref:Phosphoglucomutase/phosphomannomutase family protein n=1 Tax=Saliphagus infecundisoli TaxID=1849069 RepID=A0ABD5QIR4_9EURY|nr:phosphoglucomutase/phosphomannomutase family protein [Saliphagus infecundisoli]
MEPEAITFGTDGWRATLDEFTTPRVRIFAQGVASYLREEGPEGPVAVGYDARESSPAFAEEITRVLCANGFDVLLPERDRPTPLFAYGIVDRDLAGAVVVTASHNPPEYNGVKFIPGDGAPALPPVMDGIEDRLAEPETLPEDEHGSAREVDFVSPHADQVRELVDTDGISGLSVAYDAMHGSGRGTTDTLLERAGADVSRLRCERRADFGGSPPEPAPENLEELVERVEGGDAEVGIANDGDADRIAVVTPERGYLDENLFFAALYDYLLEDDAGPVVRTVSTTYLIDRVAEAHGESVREVPVGFKWIAQAIEEEDALVGGEESGGFTIRGHVREKDGVLMAAVAAAMHAVEPIDNRVDRLLSAHGTVVQDKTSVDCPDDEKERAIAELEDHIPEEVRGVAVEDVVTADGFKLLLADGSWLLVRPSGTEPVLRVYAEAEDGERVSELLAAGEELLGTVV